MEISTFPQSGPPASRRVCRSSAVRYTSAICATYPPLLVRPSNFSARTPKSARHPTYRNRHKSCGAQKPLNASPSRISHRASPERFCSSTSKDRPRYSKRHGCVHRPWLAGRLFTHADSRQCPDRAKHMAPCTNTSKSTPGNASASARICLKPSSRARLIRSTPASRQNATAAPFTEWACVDKCSGTDGQCFFASQITPGSAAMRPSTPIPGKRSNTASTAGNCASYGMALRQ